ncbi:MAG: DUF1565 domain-containing protein [Deltaproteobacteria bacterium]|nr:DUF1565 domain-containing protein [Deltaproteobacteria bacterium]
MRPSLVLLAAAVAACSACGGDEPTAPPSAPRWAPTCADTHEEIGPACVPRFDGCAAYEVPRVGGGCTPVGVDTCPDGFVADGSGGCAASLPKSPCADGTMALPGDTSCAPVSTCSDAPIGALRVDAAYAGSDGDGSVARPFKTVTAALAAAAPGATIAVAAGTYREDLVVDRPVIIRGRCPAEVTVRGISTELGAAAILVRAPATIAGLAITGPARGVMVDGASGVRLEELRVHDTGELAIGARDKSGPLSVDVRRVLVERAADAGVASNGGALVLSDVVVREITKGPGSLDAFGIYAGGSTATGTAGEIRVSRALVERARGGGVVALGGKLNLDRVVVRDIPGLGDDRPAIGVGTPAKSVLPSTIAIEGSLVEDTSGAAISAVGATLDARRITVRRARSSGIFLREATGTVRACRVDAATGRGISADFSDLRIDGTAVTGTLSGREQACGICAYADAAKPGRIELADVLSRGNAIGGIGVDGAELAISGARVEDNGTLGISVVDAEAKVSGAIVRRTRPNAAGQRGEGVLVAHQVGRAKLALFDSWIEASSTAGVTVFSEARIERTVVRDVAVEPKSGKLGTGILALPPLRNPRPVVLDLKSVVVERSTQAGIFLGVTTATIDACVVRETRPNPTGEFGDGIAVSAGFLDAEGRTLVPSVVTITGSLVENAARAGISVFGSELSLGGSRLWCAAVAIDVEEELDWGRRPPTLHDLGGNDCGCGSEAPGSCRARSSGLRPVPVAP